MIFALVLGCFAGAAAGDTPAYWGKDDRRTLTLVMHDGTKVPGYVSNETDGTDHLYISSNGVADSTSLSSYTPEGYYFDGFTTTSVTPGDYNNCDWIFSINGMLSYSSDSKPEYINITGNTYSWNYTYTENVILYAYYDPNYSSIIFDLNGGKISKPADMDDKDWTDYLEYGMHGWINTGDRYVSSSIYQDPTKDESKFVGWTLTRDGDELIAGKGIEGDEGDDNPLLPIIGEYSRETFKTQPIADGGYKWISLSNTEEEVITLYAKWEPISTGGSSAIILIGSKSSSSGSGPHIEYKYVTFDANGGLGEMEKQQFTGGQTKALTANQFTFAGKNFAGWALEPTGMVTYSDGQEIMVEEDLTLYAVWVEPIPENPDVGGEGEDETGIPTWLAVLLVAVVLAILIAVLVYFLVIRRGAA